MKKQYYLRINSALLKRLNKILYRENYFIKLSSPIVSFTFDDFPKTAVRNGARILRSYGKTGTFYLSLELLGAFSDVGLPIADKSDIEKIISDGHDLGDHTYNHFNAFKVTNTDYEIAIKKNREKFQELFSIDNFNSFAYPFGYLKPATKKIVRCYYRFARGIEDGINVGITDLILLKAVHVKGGIENIEYYKNLISINKEKKGWLIFFTHEVENSPTPFGCNEELLSRIIELSLESGSEIMNISEVQDFLFTIK